MPCCGRGQGLSSAAHPMKSPRLITVALAGGSLLRCGSAQVSSSAPTAADAKRPDSIHGEAPWAVFSNCLLGNANIKVARHWPSGAPASAASEDGSCTMGASCIERQGQDTPGDGRVSLTCASGQCVCRFEQLTSPGKSWEFGFSATCVSYEKAKQLMLDHCLKDMHLAPNQSTTDPNTG